MALKELYPGRWLTPDGKTSSKGLLRVGKSGLRLELIGIENFAKPPVQNASSESLKGVSASAIERFDSRLKFDVLISETVHGNIISLFDLRLSSSTGGFFDDNYENSYIALIPRYALIGPESLDDSNAMIFTGIRVETAELYKITTGTRVIVERGGSEYHSSVHILKEGESDIFELEDAELRFYNGFSKSTQYQEINISQSANVTIVLKEPSSLNILEDKFLKLNMLLEFFQGEKSNPIKLELITNKIKTQIKDTKIYQSFELVRQNGYNPNIRPSQKTAIIKLSDISDTPNVLPDWLKSDGEILKCLGWFLFIWQNEKYLVESQFVELMSILEIAPHSKGKSGTYIPKSEFEILEDNLIKQLPSELDTEVRKVFREKIHDMNKINNRALIRVSVIEFWDIISHKVDISRDDFTSVLIVNRNSISHSSKKVKNFK